MVPGAEPVPPAARGGARGNQPTILDRVRDLPIALAGTVLVVGGAVVQLIAITRSSWWHATVRGKDLTFMFSDFGVRTQRGLAFIYFSWGAWVLLVLSVALGIAGCIRWKGARPFRIAGAVLGVAGAFATIGALLTFAYQSDEGIFQIARNYTAGVYLAMLGLLATAFGAAAGGAGGR